MSGSQVSNEQYLINAVARQRDSAMNTAAQLDAALERTAAELAAARDEIVALKDKIDALLTKEGAEHGHEPVPG